MHEASDSRPVMRAETESKMKIIVSESKFYDEENNYNDVDARALFDRIEAITGSLAHGSQDSDANGDNSVWVAECELDASQISRLENIDGVKLLK